MTDPELESLIARLANDNTSGAAEIVKRAGGAFSLVDNSLSADDLIRICARLVQAQPAMAPLINLANFVIEAIKAGTSAPAASAREAAVVFLDRVEQAGRDVAMHAALLIDDRATVLTHSRSSSVVASLLEASRLGRRFSVVATESRPLLEGRTLANEMRSAGIPVTVIADAAAAAILKTASLVLVGADRVTQDNVVNKIGTRMIATAAREMNIPVYAGCDSSKFIAAAGDEDCDVEHPGAELWPDAPSGVRVLNRYFEPVPLELFSSIVTEWKMLSAEEAGATAGKKELHPLLRTALAQRR